MKKKVHFNDGMQKEVALRPEKVNIIAGPYGCGKSTIAWQLFSRHCLKRGYTQVQWRKNLNKHFEGGSTLDLFKLNLHSFGIDYRFSKITGLLEVVPYLGKVLFKGTKIVGKDTFLQSIKNLQVNAHVVDDADQITEEEFRMLVSRLRLINIDAENTSKNLPETRLYLITNPTGGWIRRMIDWYLDDNNKVIPERNYKSLFFGYKGDEIVTSEKEETLVEMGIIDESKVKELPKLKLFFGDVKENKPFLEADPNYYTTLTCSFTEYERQTQLEGRWLGASEAHFKIFKAGDFYTYVSEVEDDYHIYAVIDIAQEAGKHNDFTACTIWKYKEECLYLDDICHIKATYVNMRDKIFEFLEKHKNVSEVHIEQIHTGSALARDLENNFTERKLTTIKCKRTSKLTKVVRAKTALANIKVIKTYLPSEKLRPGIREKFLNEAMAFKENNTHKHDDIVDTFFDAIDIASKTMGNYNPNIKSIIIPSIRVEL
jgi:predicted phage terminase large subunit-like protein